MYELGKKSEIFGVELLQFFTIRGRPEEMPRLEEDDAVICGYDQGLGERMIVCESLQDMQELYDKYAQGWAINITWYTGPDPGFITTLGGQDRPEGGTNENQAS